MPMRDEAKPCRMQPDNAGISCTEQDRCERCGWNPEYDKLLRGRRRQENEEE